MQAFAAQRQETGTLAQACDVIQDEQSMFYSALNVG